MLSNTEPLSQTFPTWGADSWLCRSRGLAFITQKKWKRHQRPTWCTVRVARVLGNHISIFEDMSLPQTLYKHSLTQPLYDWHPWNMQWILFFGALIGSGICDQETFSVRMAWEKRTIIYQGSGVGEVYLFKNILSKILRNCGLKCPIVQCTIVCLTHVDTENIILWRRLVSRTLTMNI